ncbi:P-loop containing nucleoside triphosphate hydrolase protein [Tuber magnatum]|uniref:P-loop containing nucleoside triphosphate hydrolase protein n=1 Tax=Tuber magnatum TaxID=42249 RepID=A0A317SWJ2_9PEZI|nr:P-loop containing nucleoside triphosphate hydrolase protein [Tuber magnatum]
MNTEAVRHIEGLPFVAGLVTWIYIFVLATLRLAFSGSLSYDLPPLWYHTSFLYMFNFLLIAVPFRSALIHPESAISQALIITRFVLVFVLCIIAVTSRAGNKAVTQEIMDGLEPSQEPLASLFSLASFSWINPLIWEGYWKPFELSDVWNLRNDDIAVVVLSTYRQTNRKAHTLAWTLAKHFKRELAVQAAWAVFYSMFTFAPTLLLRVILQYVESPEDTPQNVAWLFVVLLFVTATLQAVGSGQALHIGRRICIRLHSVIVGEIYAKTLRRRAAAGADRALGPKGKDDGKKDSEGKAAVTEDNGEQANAGAIINLMSVDSFKVAEVCAYLHFLFAGVPVQVIIAVVLLYQILGWSSIAGIVVMFFLLPINYFISSRFSRIQKKIMAATDERIHTTNEVLQNIRIIKFFAWEARFAQVVDRSRSTELVQLRNRYILWAVAATSWYGSPIVITFLSFFCYTVIEGKALDSPIAFTALSLFNVLRVPLDQLADMVTNVLQTKVSIDRVEEYLSEEETEKYHQLKQPDEADLNAPLIGFRDAAFSWGNKKQIKNKGMGSAFQLQDLNIEFAPGYLNVIAGPTGSGKTSLLMALLGEMTHIKGSVYLPGTHSREDLIPDPVTGLTESVAYCAQQAWLVNDSIKNNILFASPYDEERYHAVLIACSLERDLQILDHGDETEAGEKGITLSGGQKQRISLARALYSNSRHILLDDCLSAVDSHTSKWIYDYCIMGPLMTGRTCILVTHNVALCVPEAKHVVVLDNGRVIMQGNPDTVVASGALGNDELLKSGVRSKPHSQMPSRLNTGNGGEPAAKKKDKTSGEETKALGSVDWRVYYLYLKSMGPCARNAPSVATADNTDGINLVYYLGIYALIGLVYTFVSFFREAVVFYGSLVASKNLHNQLLHNIMRAKFRFFDSTPLGRIINRFSKDMEAVDQEVAPSIQRSPLYQHFGETLSGISTIRAYGDERRFVRDNLSKIDNHHRPFFYLWACNRWLSFRVDIAGALVSFFAGAFVVLSVGKIDAGLAGLSLTYAVTFTDNILWLVRLYAVNEQNMNSVERVREYLEVDQEAADIIPGNRPTSGWPEKGGVAFENYSTRYRPDLDLVLKNVTFNIKPLEKVGIVGRTGAGKSSLALALFRSLEAETGKIVVDGIDISTIGLRDLRQSITMVPQDPTLFTGTIRSNLDPFGVYTDREIFRALKRNVFLDLQSPVAESGNNLSQGQKQLLCLARALLKDPVVLLMDEATASIDYSTDTKIQATIRELKSTTITIAHRLNSIIFYDKVLVLDQGKVEEFDHPHNLLQKKDSIFREMCESSGELGALEEMAKRTFMGTGTLIETAQGDDSNDTDHNDPVM